ncbi:MAG: carboxypeptidase regulatory-like domain-containing protein [Acidobacteriia bacterium]|nr:carboxypeptidase regulatory-like domain-containing protein [Terriglobia bacterium]
MLLVSRFFNFEEGSVRHASTKLLAFFSFAILLVGLLLSSTASAQGIATGSMSGTVADPSGAVIPGVKITASEITTNRTSTVESNEVGLFAIRSLPPGIYKVTIEAKGFRTAVLENIEITVARETTLGTIKMELGQVGETVQVEGASPIMESTTSQVTSSFGSQMTTDLPLQGGFDMLTLFIPGVADTGSSNFSNTNGVGFSSNGLRGRSNNFQIDGQSNNDNSVAGPSIFLGNQDALDEVSVITNEFGVEYGRASGAVVNYVTKSGGNNFHGSAFEYFTGSHWDSHDNLETATDAIPRYVENRFGGSLGGPVKRDKAWFFFSPYWDRVRSAGSPSSSGTNLTPTPAGLTQLATAFPGNPAVAVITAIGPYAVTAGSPHTIGTPVNLTVSDGVTLAPIEFAPVERNVPSLYNDREFTGRVDVQLTSKDRVSVRYIFQQNILTGATGRFAAGAWVDIPARDQQIALDWSRSFNNGIVNQARYSFSRAGFGFEGGSFPNCTRATIDACPTSITLNGGVTFGIANNLPQGRTINNTQIQDNASWTRGHHSFKFGGEFYKQRSPNTFLPSINGSYTFSSAGASAAGSCGVQFPSLPVYTGNICSFSRFLADNISSMSLTDGPPKFNFKEYDLAAYVGDDWRLKDNLTVNLGLRWEFTSQAINLLHDLSIANQAGATPFWDPALPASVTSVPQIPNDYKYFGPSIGFAWKPRIHGMTGDKTVLRGGFRITYDPAYYNIFLNVATSAPVVNAGTLTAATCTAPCLPISGALGSDVRTAHLSDIPTGVNPGARNQTRVAADFREPYTMGWSLGVQQELTSRFALELRYAGNRVNGNFQTVNANPALAGLVANGFGSFLPAGVAPCATAGTPGFASGRADCNFTNLRVRENTAWSTYHGLQSQLRIRGWRGLNGAFSFTWSKTMDNASEIFSTFSGGNTIAGAQDPYDLSRGEKALSGLDFPKVASIYLVYDLPFFKNRQDLRGRLLGGFQFNTTWRYSSGQLWTPSAFAGGSSSCQNSFDNAFFSGGSTCRLFNGNPTAALDTVGQCMNAALSDCGLVDFYTGSPVTQSAVRWIYNDDTAATFFGTPYGNAARNPGYRGDAVNTVNFSAFKTTKLTEKISMRIEAQVYNLLNHRFLGVPDPFVDDANLANGGTFANNYSNSSGGDYTNVGPAGLGRRRLVLGAKFTF